MDTEGLLTEELFLKSYKPESNSRMRFAFMLWITLFAVCAFVGINGFWIYEVKYISGLMIGVGLWILVLSYTFKLFLVSVPEITALVTINWWGKVTKKDPYKNLRPYRTGMHFKYPWEQVEDGNFITLRLVTKTVVEDYPSRDGPLMKTKWSYQYRPRWWQLPTYIAVDESTIERGISDVGSAFLSEKIAGTDAIECKITQSTIGAGLQKKFEAALPKSTTTEGETEGSRKDESVETKASLEDLYGIDMTRVALADVDFDEAFQKVRTSEQVANRLNNMASEIKSKAKDGSISDKEALNTALIINGQVTKNIQGIEGSGGEAIGSLMMAMARGGSSKGDSHGKE